MQYTRIQDREKTISIYFLSSLVFRFEFLKYNNNNNIGNTIQYPTPNETDDDFRKLFL